MRGTDATPERLYLMQLGTASIPVPTGTIEMSAGCYLVRMSDGTHVLIDSGLPTDYQALPDAPPTENMKDVIAHLADLGLRPEDITVVICTHFDVDHAGHNDAFTAAAHIVQRAHYERARSGDARYAAVRSHWDHPALRYRLVDGDTDVLPGLTVIETSGHAPGHQSVLVRLPRTGPVLLAIDAVAMERLFTPDRPAWPGEDDLEQLRASVRKLRDLVEREQVALVVFGHDGRQWQTLTKAPGYYE